MKLYIFQSNFRPDNVMKTGIFGVIAKDISEAQLLLAKDTVTPIESVPQCYKVIGEHALSKSRVVLSC